MTFKKITDFTEQKKDVAGYIFIEFNVKVDMFLRLLNFEKVKVLISDKIYFKKLNRNE